MVFIAGTFARHIIEAIDGTIGSQFKLHRCLLYSCSSIVQKGIAQRRLFQFFYNVLNLILTLVALDYLMKLLLDKRRKIKLS